MTVKKTAFVTGANQGLGFETVKQLAQLGYYVYLGSRNKFKGIAAQEKLNASGFNDVEFVELDVTDINSIKSARQVVETKTQHLDVLINNEGIAGEQPQNISTIKLKNLGKYLKLTFSEAYKRHNNLLIY